MPERYDVRIPDREYWREMICCRHACPVGTDARGYVRAIAEGDLRRAYRIARGPNPLASMCGRVCGAPCEAACRRGKIDAPVSIRALKRFACSGYGPESPGFSASGLPDTIGRIEDLECGGPEEFAALLRDSVRGNFLPAGGEPVAIVGSGPAGLAAAHDLALLGFRPTVFEWEPVPAGMLHLGVPPYRLPRDLIRSEIAVIESLGVEIRCGRKVGRDIAFPDLLREYAAILIAVGAKRSRKLDIPGAGGEGVIGGVDFLRAVALGEPVPLGRRVVVVGGGSVAFDVSRSALRHEDVDVSRTALRQAGVREVSLCCIESLEEMPADPVEVREGEEEGIRRYNRVAPLEILLDAKGRVREIVFQKVVSVFDEARRFAPRFDPGERTALPADTVILAIGQTMDVSFLDPERDGVAITPRGLIEVDRETLRTTNPKVFVAGDAAHGTRLMIDAIASGKRAARSIYRAVTGRDLAAEQVEAHLVLEPYAREKGYEAVPRLPVPAAPVDQRIGRIDLPVETGYGPKEAAAEAARCLDCGVNTIFDSERCVLCGGCADVCPTLCLKLVPLEELSLDPAAAEALTGAAGGGKWSAILKDEDRCIRCANCANRCPVGAITMERYTFREVWKCPQPAA
jgi:NADPH-dependent glutamate synthase beta subunit-like oxidoreductase